MTEEGWGYPGNSQKAHYFIDRTSLCNRWLYLGPLEHGNDDSEDNCRKCIKLLKRRRGKPE